MIHKVWTLFFIFIAFNVIINTSHGSPNQVTNDLKKLAIANNDLGLNLYQTLVENTTSGNVFISPLSLSTALAMVFYGANGNTAEQLRTVLGYDAANLPSGKVPSTFNEYMNAILSNEKQKADYVLNLANELLVSNSFEVSPNYKKEVQDKFHANIKEVDFETNSPQIVNEVNDWVKEQTHGKIDKLLNDLQPSTVLLILNAIYFKGDWKYSFDQKLTKQQKFYNDGSDSKAKKVPLMHMTARLPFASIDDMQALELPYKGDNISMIILLPKERNGLKRLEDSITTDRFLNIQKRMRLSKVIVTFPKFKVEYEKQMVPVFEAIGAENVFTPGVADLSGLSPKNKVYISKIVHKAAIEVNEEGSVAAAATAIEIVPYSLPIAPPPPPPVFTADHPFMYAIVDKRNDLILFLSRVTEL